MMGTPEDLTEIQSELVAAIKQFDDTETLKKKANRNHTESTNRLNNAQKAFDAAVEKMKSTAAWDTKWSSAKRRGRRCD